VLEGDHQPNRVVVLEFPSVEKAREWYGSEEYAGPLALRRRSSRSSMILVEGYAPPA
jgi:uncharacterized protein (DUF1330 family)